MMRDILDVNVIGIANSVQAAFPYLKHSKNPRIVALSSILGRTGMTDMTAYSASKWAVIGMIKSWALDVNAGLSGKMTG